MARVLVVGDSMLDVYRIGEAHRLSPEAPVPVFVETHENFGPGGAANLATALVRLGVPADLVSWWGNDRDGEKLAELLSQDGVETIRAFSSFQTNRKERLIAGSQTLLRIDTPRQIPGVADDLASLPTISANDYDFVAVSDYGQHVSNAVPEVLKIARAAGVPVFVDPKGNNLSRYRGAFFLKPNRREFLDLFGCPLSEEGRIFDVMAANEIQNLLVTLGPSGMTLFEGGSRSATAYGSGSVKDVFDVSGAGDIVLAAVIGALRHGLSLVSATECANQTAQENVSHSGAELSTGAGRVFFDAVGLDSSSLPNVELLLRSVRRDGRKIVFTNGCFDLLHRGHLAMLREARLMGDFLVLGLNSDISVKSLKGPDRPFFPFEERLAVISALRFVDLVVPFDDLDPLSLIKVVRPDVLVKGPDYFPEDIVGFREVVDGGGKVHVVELEHDISSTAVIQRIEGRTR